MMFYRRTRLLAVLIVSVASLPTLIWAQQNSQPAQPPTQSPKPSQNPFEAVPQTQEPAPVNPAPTAPVPNQAPGQQPQLEAPAPAPQTAAPASAADTIADIEFRGSRRVPQDTLRALIFSRRGDRYSEDSLHRDFMALWNTGRFDDIKLERETGDTGIIIRFLLTERRVIRTIKYEGAKSVTVSEILDRFKERKVGLSVESQYDPNKIQRATNVLKEFLSERGRQFAIVQPEIRQIPPSSLEIVFQVTEGPKVKVGTIEFEGNQAFSDLAVRRAMKLLRPIGIPRSILFENLFAKSFDQTKFEHDQELIRNNYMENGYFTARVVDGKVTMRDVGGKGFRIPLLKPNKPGKVADLDITIEEGKLYKLNKINFSGVKLFKTPDALMRPIFQMDEGDVFSTAKLRKGMEELRKLYGRFGYIDFVPEPDPQPLPGTDKIDLTFNFDEGKQFFVRRIDFSGNTTTRDKVIRREILIDEGQVFNTAMWDVSILRLNQLGYFEALKENESATITRDPKTSTVDINLAVKERGKNSIQMNGGVSGIAGSFIGFSYSTNNFLGLGETLSLDSQIGDRIRNVTFGFTEPYLFDRPIQSGFTIYTQRFNYDQGREVSLTSGRDYTSLFSQLGTENLLNYVTNGYGFTTFVSAPWKRTFSRVGLTYGYDTSNITTLTEAAKNQFEYINFQGLNGPNQLNGIRTSKVTPYFSHNTVNHPITPTQGKSIYLSAAFAGSVLGGNVNSFEPTIDVKYFRAGFRKGHVIGMHGLGRFITGFGGLLAPPFNRFHMGGENDVRGFQIWQISPGAYVPSETLVSVYNSDGTPRVQKSIVNGQETLTAVQMRVPFYQFILPGGDTSGVANFEYRIPIVGPVILAAFFDAGINRISRPNQLTLNPQRIASLNGTYPQANFASEAKIVPGMQGLRTSTGLELQVIMPVVNAPFRLYWAYNPTTANTYIQPPIVADRSAFPNQETFLRALQGVPGVQAGIGQGNSFVEKRSSFRFSIGRTF